MAILSRPGANSTFDFIASSQVINWPDSQAIRPRIPTIAALALNGLSAFGLDTAAGRVVSAFVSDLLFVLMVGKWICLLFFLRAVNQVLRDRMIGEQLVADVMEITDQRNAHAKLGEPLLDARYSGGCFIAIDGNAHELGASSCQRRDLPRRSFDIGGVGIGHRLHHYWCIASDANIANLRGVRLSALDG